MSKRIPPWIRENTPGENARIVRAARDDPDNPSWTKADFTRAYRGRGPQKAPTKQQTTLRLDRDIIAYFKAGGKGWQTRINDTLRKAIGL